MSITPTLMPTSTPNMIQPEQLIHFSPSCERNKQVILDELQHILKSKLESTNVLELGSYSGQHAMHICRQLPHVTWQTSDVAYYLDGLTQNLSHAKLSNCLIPLELDVSNEEQWPSTTFDIIFTANSLHIMSWQHVKALFSHVSKVCKVGTYLVIYGPFKYQGQFTSESNEDFELWLKDRDKDSGIKDFEQISELAQSTSLHLMDDITMPANNQLLIFQQC